MEPTEKRFNLKPEMYKALFENNRIAQLLIESKTMNIRYANLAACLFYQYSLDEFQKLNISDINVLSSHDIRLEMIRAQQEKRNFFNFKHRLKDGSIVAVEIISYPIELEGEKYLLSSIYRSEMKNRMGMLYTSVFSASPDAIAILDEHETVIAINESFSKLFGYTIGDLIGQKLDRFIIPDELINHMSEQFQDGYQGKVTNVETIRKTKNNINIHVRVMMIPYFHGNDILGSQVIYHDITEKVKNEEELNLFKEIIQNNTDGVMITDAEQKITWVNQSFEIITGFSMKDALHETPKLLSSGLNSESFYQRMSKTLESTGEWQGEIWNRRKNGVIYPQWLHIFAMHDSKGKPKNFIGIFKDLSEIDSVNKKILLMIEKDPLTSLYNRIYFMERIRQMVQLKQKDRFLLFLDINGFKNLNDTYGHQIGDQILIEFSRTLMNVFKDAYVARYGGDEFVVHFNELTTKKHLVSLIEQFCLEIHSNIVINEKEFKLSCSVGVAKYPQDGRSVDEIIRSADQAMYHAKTNNIPYAFWPDIKD